MIDRQGVIVIREDTAINGQIRNCREIEIYGLVEGELNAGNLIVHEGGRLYGIVKVDNAEIRGDVQGEVYIRQLASIGRTGTVTGKVRYGQLAMEAGANLNAEVRNVPPTLAGDLALAVDRGRAVIVTRDDLTALDPDDSAENLVYTVSNAVNGFVLYASAPGKPISGFTQADLESGRVAFKHDGTNTTSASFDVVVADRAGATSGAAQTVAVAVAGR